MHYKISREALSSNISYGGANMYIYIYIIIGIRRLIIADNCNAYNKNWYWKGPEVCLKSKP